MRRSTLVLVLSLCACSEPLPLPGVDSGGVDGGSGEGGIDACAPGACVVDPCDATECPDPRHLCVTVSGSAECRCPGGTHAEGDRCVDDTTCTDTTCAGGGLCSDTDGVLSCACADGYVGDRCEGCATGYLRDGEGLCDADLCDPSPCSDLDRLRCVIADGATMCLCNAGTHDEAGACVPDTTCTPETCDGRGTCSATAEGLTCACDEGFAGQFCETCDDALGYHADGAGGCTLDACLPDPCTAPPFTRCLASAAGTSCECPLGAHREGGSCAPDEVCTGATCSDRGACTMMDGRTACDCDAGYAGASCESCDVGFHDDGLGGCTDDACMPSPCTTPNRGVCTSGATGAVCACDAGYHDDGVGGCTTDPCLPHPCGAEACRTSGSGAAECFTPVCDDSNPCTTDTPSGASCVYAPVANGSACSTTACVSGQTCSAGSCGGGTTVSCADANPCTVDACDAIVGCTHVVSAAIVPDDGIACTTGSCASGAPVHTASDAACDDALWCTGVERCAPTDAARDARGCVRSSVPVPPGGSSPCASYGACSEATDSFPIVTRMAGASCDDGIGCTSSDVCVTTGGACVGTVTGSCGASGSCGSTVPWSTTLDVPTASVTGAIRIDGAAAPTIVPSTGYGTASLWLVAEDTGVRHLVGQLRYTTGVTGGYRFTTGDDLIDVRMVPGVYDLLYDRDTNTSSTGSGDRWVGEIPSAVTVPAGWRILREDVVIGPGANVLNVDVSTASVTGTITVDGVAAPTMVPSTGYGTASVWAIARDTGARHLLGQLRYTTGVTGGYRFTTGDDLIDVRLVPGTYDILYDRDSSTSSTGSGDRWVGEIPGAVSVPSGWRILRAGVVVPAGASTLNVDIPTSTVTGAITVDGAPAPTMVPSTGYGTASVWAIARDTGVRHLLGQLRYTTGVTGGYRFTTGDDLIDLRLVPGTYDILYDRDTSTSSTGSGDRWVGEIPGAVSVPSGWRILREGVVVPAGASTLNVDIPTSTVTGAITIDGAAAPTMVPSTGYGTASVWAIARDTGVRHLLGQLRYTTGVTGGYRFTTGDDLIDLRLVPGTYDLLYDRDTSTSSTGSGDRWVGEIPSAVSVPSGWRILRAGVVIPPGASTLIVDVPTASVTGSITVGGAVAPTMVPSTGYGTASLWAIARDTGVRHLLGQLRYTTGVTGGYRFTVGDDLIDLRLVPGTYDVLYDRDSNTSSTGSGDRWVGEVPGAVTVPAGWRVIREGLVVSAGSNVLTVDVPTSALTGRITLDGAMAPTMVASTGYGTASVWAVARDTGVRHLLGQLRYTTGVTGGYRFTTGDDLVDVRLVPGTYDLLYDRDTNTSSTGSGDRWVGEVPSAVPVPAGWRVLRQCVVFP